MRDNKVYVDQDLKSLIPGFIENRKEEIEKLKGLIKGEKFEEIKRLGHTIKGTGGGYGFDLVTELGIEIENAAAEKDKAKVEKVINELEDHIENAEVIYE